MRKLLFISLLLFLTISVKAQTTDSIGWRLASREFINPSSAATDDSITCSQQFVFKTNKIEVRTFIPKTGNCRKFIVPSPKLLLQIHKL